MVEVSKGLLHTTQWQIKTGMYLGHLVSLWPDLLFFMLPSYPRRSIMVIWSYNQTLKILGLKWGRATHEKKLIILWWPGELSLLCESHLVPQTNSPEATMKGREKSVLKITHRCTCWVGGWPWGGPSLQTTQTLLLGWGEPLLWILMNLEL